MVAGIPAGSKFRFILWRQNDYDIISLAGLRAVSIKEPKKGMWLVFQIVSRSPIPCRFGTVPRGFAISFQYEQWETGADRTRIFFRILSGLPPVTRHRSRSDAG